ncbi:hypothetical protein FHL15_009565 [Xylaria flabelliformis]|uniref:Uncharacterized protein n=1 Tax=Xylaria flabelliformis TaxID=2512241 RepID=A0A553HNI4_9PEZI|nr:hypothetical protein FHL15_009565 [Xylaria flabelliformis]
MRLKRNKSWSQRKPSVGSNWRLGTVALGHGSRQQILTGAVLLAMSSWHLYPIMEIWVNEIKPVDQNDELMKGGLITISAHGVDPYRFLACAITGLRTHEFHPESWVVV